MKIKDFITKLQNLPDDKKKMILWTTVVILAIIMIYFLIAGVINNFHKVNEALNSSNQQNISASTENTLTADWSTYTNEKYGFEIKYPKDFNVEEKTGEIFFAGKNLNNLKLEGFFSSRIKIKDLSANENSIEYKKSELSMDGVDSYKIDSISCYMGCGSGYIVYIPYKNGSIVIGIMRGDGSEKEEDLVRINQQEKDLFDQIISTFKFIK